jgi:hypothetical protein
MSRKSRFEHFKKKIYFEQEALHRDLSRRLHEQVPKLEEGNQHTKRVFVRMYILAQSVKFATYFPFVGVALFLFNYYISLNSYLMAIGNGFVSVFIYFIILTLLPARWTSLYLLGFRFQTPEVEKQQELIALASQYREHSTLVFEKVPGLRQALAGAEYSMEKFLEFRYEHTGKY